MDQFVVHEDQREGKKLHALVIGVGDYPHLLDGSAQLTASHDGMGQLTSPPVSARALADWLIGEYHHEDYSVGTVALLLSEAQSTSYSNPKTGQSHSVELATYQNLADATVAWRTRGDADPEDLLVFYFCGHGISEGDSMILLPRDFGENPNNAYDHALDFLALYNAMQQAQARRQCFFVDACRASSDTLGNNNARSPLQEGPRTAPGTRIGPVYYSTLQGKDAHGRAGQPSIFTEALLASLRDFGSTDDEGDDDWRVSNYALSDALEHLMSRAEAAGTPIVQVPDSTAIRERFYICHLTQTPRANLIICSEPVERLRDAELVCTRSGSVVDQRAPIEGEDWVLPVPTGDVTVTPRLLNEADARAPKTTHARPPFKRLRLDLQ